MPLPGFSEFMEGSRALREGFLQGEEVRNLRADRRIKEEQRLRMMEANKAMASSVRKKPGIWRDAETTAAYLEGGYDATRLPAFMRQEFAPHDPWNVMQANLAREITKSAGELAKMSPEDVKSGANASLQFKHFTNMTLLNRDVFFKDAAGNVVTPLLDILQPSAAQAINESALRETEKLIGSLPDDDPLKDLEMGKTARHIQKKLFEEQATLPSVDRRAYGDARNWLKSATMDDIKTAIEDKVITYKDSKGNDLVQDLSTYPALMETLKYIIHAGSLEKMMLKGEVIDADTMNAFREQLAAKKIQDKEPPLDMIDFTGKIFGEEAPPTAVERLKTSRSKTKRIIGAGVEAAGELPTLGAETLGRTAGRIIKRSYERRTKEAQEEEREEEDYRKRLRANRGK